MPITRLAVETMPSLAPITEARSHPVREDRWVSGACRGMVTEWSNGRVGRCWASVKVPAVRDQFTQPGTVIDDSPGDQMHDPAPGGGISLPEGEHGHEAGLQAAPAIAQQKNWPFYTSDADDELSRVSIIPYVPLRNHKIHHIQRYSLHTASS